MLHVDNLGYKFKSIVMEKRYYIHHRHCFSPQIINKSVKDTDIVFFFAAKTYQTDTFSSSKLKKKIVVFYLIT